MPYVAVVDDPGGAFAVAIVAPPCDTVEFLHPHSQKLARIRIQDRASWVYTPSVPADAIVGRLLDHAVGSQRVFFAIVCGLTPTAAVVEPVPGGAMGLPPQLAKMAGSLVSYPFRADDWACLEQALKRRLPLKVAEEAGTLCVV